MEFFSLIFLFGSENLLAEILLACSDIHAKEIEIKKDN